MKQVLIFIFVLGIGSNLLGQDKIYYKADGMYLVLKEDGRETEIPFGKNVRIEYDKFFKSYGILYDSSDGTTGGIILSYIEKKKKENIVRMIDRENGINFSVRDLLNENGILFMFFEKKEDGVMKVFVIKGATKL